MPGKVIVCLSPHADDVEIGMGGFMCRAAAEGALVHSVLLTASEYSRPNGETVTGATRIREHRRACTLLGIEPQICEIGGTVNLQINGDVVAKLDSLLHKLKPAALYVPLPWYNHDHTVVFEAAMAATRPVGSAYRVPELWAYELPGQDHGPKTPWEGWHYIGLTSAQMSRKTDAVECHQSQMHLKGAGQNHLVGVDGIKALGRLRSLEASMPPTYPYAERFHLIRSFSE